jgi:hypothetical protein
MTTVIKTLHRSDIVQDTSHFPSSVLAELPDPCGPTRSTTENLEQKRYVVAGDHLYSVGTLDGGFPPIGTRIRGEMGGVWAQPIKLLTGFWFALNGEWLPAATSFTSGAGYVQMHIPALDDIEITRTEFAPDGFAALLVGLTLYNAAAHDQRVALKFAARSQLMGAYPWNDTTPSADELNRKDTASYDPAVGTLTFHTPDRHWYAIVGASLRASHGAADDDSWGPLSEAQHDGYSQAQWSAGAMLRWDIDLAVGEEQTLWLVVAGSHTAREEAEETVRLALADPSSLLRAKISARTDLLAQVQVELPDPQLLTALEWATMNMADLRRTVTDVHIRDVDEGKAYPPPVKTILRLSGIGDGFPDYPSFYGTGSGYIVYPLAASGMWEIAMEHLRLLRDVSRAINGDSGKVVHEIICDGSVHFGNNAARGDTNETALFATAVELLWRWSGDDAFRDEMYEFILDGMHYITTELDSDGDLWPEGNGIAERPGMGSEHVDVAAATWQGLHALTRMAEGRGDSATAAWARAKADAIETAFDEAWWVEAKSLYADSLCNGDDVVSERDRQEKGWTNVCGEPNQQLQQGIWVSVTPMEPSLAPPERAHAALSTLETPAYSGACGLYLVGEGGGPDGKAVKKCWTVMAGVMALAEANYGRVGAQQALRYMQAIASLIDLEQPGALPELAPSPDYDPFVDLTERMMFMQAWATYGISWTIVRCLLGVDADIPAGRLSVVPQIPPPWPGLAVKRLRLGTGSIAVSAERDNHRFRTSVEAPGDLRLTIGHTLPAGLAVEAVTLDDAQVEYEIIETIRGREVRVQTMGGTPHTLVVTTADSDNVLILEPEQARVLGQRD